MRLFRKYDLSRSYELSLTNRSTHVQKVFSFCPPQTYSIQGRGTVVSGRLEQGTIKKDDKIEILGHNQVIKSSITGTTVDKFIC